MKRWDALKRNRILPALMITVVLALSNTAVFSIENFFNMVRQMSTDVMIAAGMSIVVFSGGIDLSVGAQVSLIGVLGATSMMVWGISPAATVGICLAAAVLLGLVNGFIITRFHIVPIISTLATATIYRGVSYILTGGYALFPLPRSFQFIGQGYVGPIPVPMLIMIAMLLAGGFIMNQTYYGKYFYAIGQNERMAAQAGLNINKIKMLAYSFNSFFTGVAAIVILSRVNSGQPSTGLGIELDILTALALGGIGLRGGRGKIYGVVIGVICMFLIGSVLTMLSLKDYYRSIIKGSIFLLAIALDQLKIYKAGWAD